MKKIDYTETSFFPFKSMFAVSVVLLQNSLETTSPFTDALRLREFPPRLTALCIGYNMVYTVDCASVTSRNRL